MIKVTVIIPVYNVAKYLERSLHSLFSQTLKEIQYIIVDDHSTDNSLEVISYVLKQYPHRKKDVLILKHPKNLGVAVARTTGMKKARGEYLIHCDPDDYIELNMYEKLYHQAKKNDSDLVTCYHYLNEKPIFYRYANTPQLCLRNMYKKNSQYVHLWSKMVKTQIIKDNDIFPIKDINFEEDLNTSIRIFHYSKTISVVKEPLYHYCLRENSLSTSLFKKFDPVRLKSLEANLKILKKLGNGKYRLFENYLIYRVKFTHPEIFNNEKDWFNWKKECHRDILKYNQEPLKNRLALYIAMSNYYCFKIAKRFLSSLEYVKK